MLVSEVMLQQTQAARVAPAFERFVEAFPTVGALAGASPADVLRAWGGLGYNRRALNLHRAARAIVRDHGGAVPGDPAVLVSLPGVGPYTAAAVASLGFGVPVAAVDVNVRRVVSRVLLGGDAGGRGSGGRGGRVARPGRPEPLEPGGHGPGPRGLPAGSPMCGLSDRSRVPLPEERGGGASTGARRTSGVRRQAPFAGSTRQVRGAVVRVLRDESPCTLEALARRTGHPPDRVAGAVAALHREGLVEAGPAALRGRPRGSVRLPS